MPQTKFVVGKALKLGLKPIVAINKIDKPEARATEVVNEVFDLFAALDATDEQLDFPIIYGSAKQGWMADSPTGSQENMAPLFDLIVSNPPYIGDREWMDLAPEVSAFEPHAALRGGRAIAHPGSPA